MGFYTVYKKQKEYRYMKKTIKRKQKLGIRIGVGCALVITVILLAVQGVSNLTKKPVDTSEGIAYIKGKESADAKTIEQKINQLEKKDGTGESSDTRSMKERFSGAVVMGDSIAASFTEYDVLNTSSVVAKIGIHFSELDDQIEQAKQLDPQIIFLAYGMNDVTKTNGDVDKFIKDYSDVIKKIQKAMPDAHIFVNAVFPVQESAVEKEPALANIADYNEKLEAMCEKKQIGYIDNSDIIEDEYYEEDGIHFKANFYPSGQKRWRRWQRYDREKTANDLCDEIYTFSNYRGISCDIDAICKWK